MDVVRTLSSACLKVLIFDLFVCFLGGCGGDDGSAPGPQLPVQIRATSVEPVAPGSTTTIGFTATNAGAPLAGRSFRLYAPEKGPQVQFDSGTTLDVITGADGAASAQITSGAQTGPVLIGLRDMATGVEYTIPVSISTGTPTLSGAIALTEISKQFSNSASARLHGPALLLSGDTLWDRPADGSPPPPPAAGPAPGSKWVFWYDEEVGAQFTHPTKWIVLDANDASAGFAGRAQVTNHVWFPSVLTASDERYPLIPGNWTQTPDDTPPPSTRGTAPSDKACAILVSGPNLEGTLRDLQAVRSQLIDSGRVPRDNIDFYPTPVLASEIYFAIEHAKAMGCKKLYFYYVGHGQKGAMALEDARGDSAPLFYDELARKLAAAGIPEVCVLLQTCHSATAIQPFQNLGNSGEIVTSAGEENSSLSVWDPESGSMRSPYTTAFTDALSNPDADRPPPDGFVSFREAAAYVAQNNTDPNVSYGVPVAAGIGETDPTTMPLPDVKIIKVGDTSTVTITRPTGLDAKEYAVLTLTIADGSTATFANGSTTTQVVLNNNAESVNVPIKGAANGATTYSVSARAGTGAAFSGEAEIEVGGRYEFSVKPLEILVGQSVTSDILRKGAFVGSGEISRLNIAGTDPESVAISTDFVVMSNDSKTLTFTGLSPGVSLVAAIDEERGLRAEVEVRVYQELTLEYDLRLAGGTVVFHKGDKIRGDRIRNYHIVGPHVPICDHWHYHAATPEGIFIDDLGPFPDPEEHGCGYGHALEPPMQ
ncbi:MAG: hypothetical protein ACAH95_10100 [Fimbriimonas sp.]